MKGRLLTILGLVFLLGAPAARADFLDSYKQGLDAVEAADWATVSVRMKEAIADQPNADARVAKRLYFRRYIPHYFLGLALFETGDCPGAVRSWGTSEQQGVIQKYPEYQDLQAKRTVCNQIKADREATIASARATIQRAEEASKTIEGLPGPALSSLWESGDPSLAQRTAQARRNLTSAQESFDPNAEKAAAEAVLKLAERAALGFEGVQRDAEQMRSRLEAERQAAAEDMAPLRAQAQRTLDSIAFLRPYPGRIRGLVERLEGLLAASRSSGPGSTAEDLQRLRGSIENAIGQIRRETAPPPRELTKAAEALFSADYATVVELLGDTSFFGSRTEGHVHLFLSAARFSLWVISGESDEELLAAASRDALASRKASPNLVPTRQEFSPRFVEFFLAQEEVVIPEDEIVAPDDSQAADPSDA